MESLNHEEFLVLFLSLGVLLGSARLLGELAQHFGQPAIIGELLAGVLLGPTVLGNLAPDVHGALFPASGPNAIALTAIVGLAGVLFLLVAGMKVDLSTARRQGGIAHRVSAVGIFTAVLCGFIACSLFPKALGYEAGTDMLVFSLFVSTALLVSALPIIAKTLMDLDLYRTDLGMIVVSAAIVEDLVGWILFAVVLGLAEGKPVGPSEIMWSVALTLGFAVAMLSVVRALIHRVWPYVQAYSRWPGGVLSFALVLGILGAAAAEWVGIHAIFGAFLAGAALGDSPHLRERTRVTIEHFVSFIFAPIFFSSIGLHADFVAHFDVQLVVVIIVVACISKLAGGALGARWGGLPRREAWAVGFAVNSRGETEMILGLLALEAGIISQDLFVALVIMAIATSTMAGPAMRILLRRPQPQHLSDALSARLFVPALTARTAVEAIRELAGCAGTAGYDAGTIETLALAREDRMSTGLANGIAMPHARLPGLQAPVVVVGIARNGIDFDAPDGQPAQVIILVLTPEDDPGSQLTIAADIARLFRNPRVRATAYQCTNYTDFLGCVRSEDGAFGKAG